MKRIRPELVAVHEDVYRYPASQARVERMLARLDCSDFRTVNDRELAELVRDRWSGCGETSTSGVDGSEETKRVRDPDLVFTRWDFDGDADLAGRRETYPELVHRNLLGTRGLDFRDDANPLRMQGSICTQAWEFHSVIGCLFHCTYCGLGKTFVNIAANIEEQVAMLDTWTKRNNFQTVYKWDNATDINCFEPEFDATRLFVEYFRDCPDKYLLHYTGKSDNVDFMLDYDHGGKTIVQWSLAPRTQAARVEVASAPWDARIEAARKCQEAGYIVRFRFSPILPVKNWREEYAELIERLFARTRPDVISLYY